MKNKLRKFLAIVCAALLMAPALANAQATDLFTDAGTELNALGTKYSALLKIAFTAIVVVSIVFALVKRGAKKATG